MKMEWLNFLLVSGRLALSGLMICIFILLLIIIFLSISNIKHIKKEKLLSENQELLRTAINALPDIICFKDSEGRWIEANNAMLNLYDSEIAIIGKTDRELSQLMSNFSEEFQACERTDNEVWRNGSATMVEESFRQPNGEVRTFDVVKVPLFHENGNRKGLVVLGREITERKKSEEIKKQAEESTRLLNELKHYDKIKTEFFANLSHELRTPLNLILGSVQLIQLMKKNGSLDKENCKVDNYISIIKQNCYRLIRIVNNLIDITKIDSGYMELDLKNENMVSIIEDITLSVKDYTEGKGLSLVFDTDIEEKLVYCDPDKIERIVLNLLSNAIKFTEPGGGIKVSITDKADSLQVSIKDTGIGIPKEKQPAIFERFIQVDKSLSRNREGSGIGLSLVKSFVEMHGGTILLNSEPGHGSEFIFEIPAALLPGIDSKPIESFDLPSGNKIEIINIEFSDIYS